MHLMLSGCHANMHTIMQVIPRLKSKEFPVGSCIDAILETADFRPNRFNAQLFFTLMGVGFHSHSVANDGLSSLACQRFC